MQLILLGNKKGVSIIEILVAIVVIVVALTGLLGLASFSLRASGLIEQTTQANSLAQESLEALRNFRDGTYWDTDGLGPLSAGIDYHLQKTGSPLEWQIIQGSEVVGIFTRKIVLNNVLRDASDNIVQSGGVNDPKTKKITATVSWQERGKNHQVELVAYLTAWKQ
ncbi:MAG: hypothetical protein HY443_01985 [Candidatus Nealsonbacteria bacterium]|nr:hypothetical protein [Candidatus Nealsonbacteria bacterium]